jgi:hypothetical protein
VAAFCRQTRMATCYQGQANSIQRIGEVRHSAIPCQGVLFRVWELQRRRDRDYASDRPERDGAILSSIRSTVYCKHQQEREGKLTIPE